MIAWARWRTSALGVVLLSSLNACSPMTASTRYTAHAKPNKDTTEMAVAAECTLRVERIVDDRMDPSVLGNVGGRVVKASPDPQAWLRSVIAGISSSGIAVTFGDARTAPADPLTATAELRTAWVSSAATSKIATVVVSFHYFHDGTLLKSADYRGSLSSPNWSSTEHEIQSLIDRALDQVLSQAVGDTLYECSRLRALRGAG